MTLLNKQDYLEDLECPVCCDIMEPPIRTCVVGHSICDNCFNNVTACPICRGEIKGDRNYFLEDLGRTLTYKCTNKYEGCDFEGSVQEMKQHSDFCKYSVSRCPLQNIGNCKWYGKIQDIMRHCFEKHPNNTFSTEKQKLVCRNFLEPMKENTMTLKHYYILFEAHGELFKFLWDLNCSSGFMLWRAIYLGPNERALDFGFTLDFQNPIDEEDKLHFEGHCQPLDLKKFVTSMMYVPTMQKTLANYCSNSDLHYTISIHKIPRNELIESGTFDSAPNDSAFEPESCICRF